MIRKARSALVEGKSEPYAPYINWYSNGKVNVNVYNASNANPNYSEPEGLLDMQEAE